MKKVFVSCRCYASVLKLLKTLSAEPIIVPELPLVGPGTSYHTDLSLCVLGGTVVCAPSLYDKIKDLEGFSVVKGSAEPCEPYPDDILYNAALVGRFLFCREDKTDKKILEVANSENIEILNVKQGYARCSIFPVTDTALITSDPSVFRVASKVGLDVLKVSDGDVILEGYPHGFIGGTGGTVCGKALFCGDISGHSDYEEIKEFCEKHGVDIVYTNEPLRDFGSLLC